MDSIDIKHIKSVGYGMLILFLTYFVRNPFFVNCTDRGCNDGSGFPLPYFFVSYCQRGTMQCLENYFSPITFIVDSILVVLAVILIRAFAIKEPDEPPLYTTK